MARRAPSRRRTARLKAPPAAIERFAEQCVDAHQVHLDSGYKLTGASGAWRRNNGCLTVRLVYRKRRGPNRTSTIAYTIRELPEAEAAS